ncbi:MAG: hypothetical protein QXP03_07250 [Desulfurococcaceae archaeon]
MTTFVVSRTTMALVVKTGSSTKYGKIGRDLQGERVRWDSRKLREPSVYILGTSSRS